VFAYSSRLSSQSLQGRLARTGGLLATILLALSAAPALAAGATCPGQTLTQPFTAWGDLNYYTLAPGGNFVNPVAAGWKLSGGAQIVQTTQPNGTVGPVLDLPSHAQAISAPMCVTLEYQTARVFVRNVKGTAGVSVGLSYTGTSTMGNPQYTGTVYGKGSSWNPSEPFNVNPQIAGSNEGTREVQFVFVAGGSKSDFQLYDLYVDPRMR
jgi:hypothetical protein